MIGQILAEVAINDCSEAGIWQSLTKPWHFRRPMIGLASLTNVMFRLSVEMLGPRSRISPPRGSD